MPGGNLPVCQAALEHGGEEVQAVDGPVPGWLQACEGQAGGEEVHDAAQLVAHLQWTWPRRAEDACPALPRWRPGARSPGVLADAHARTHTHAVTSRSMSTHAE